MPQSVVDVLEVIEVEIQQRERRRTAAAREKRCVETFGEGPAIHQAGERVRLREL